MTKACVQCRETKPLSEYYVQKKTRDGFTASCKLCTAAMERDNRRKRIAAATAPFSTNEPRLYHHNLKALDYLLMDAKLEKIDLQQIDAIDRIRGGIQLMWFKSVRYARVFTHREARDFNLSFNSTALIAQYLDNHELKVILPTENTIKPQEKE